MPRNGIAGSQCIRICVFLIWLRSLSKTRLLSEMATLVYIPTNNVWGFYSSTIFYQNLALYKLPIVCSLIRLNLIRICLTSNYFERFLLWLLIFWAFYIKTSLFIPLTYFKFWVAVCFSICYCLFLLLLCFLFFDWQISFDILEISHCFFRHCLFFYSVMYLLTCPRCVSLNRNP